MSCLVLSCLDDLWNQDRQHCQAGNLHKLCTASGWMSGVAAPCRVTTTPSWRHGCEPCRGHTGNCLHRECKHFPWQSGGRLAIDRDINRRIRECESLLCSQLLYCTRKELFRNRNIIIMKITEMLSNLEIQKRSKFWSQKPPKALAG